MMTDDENSLGNMSSFLGKNVEAVAVLGAKAVVLTKFLDAALPHLSASQCADVSASFRRGIDDTLSAMDDLSLPPKYQRTPVELTDAIVNTLKR